VYDPARLEAILAVAHRHDLPAYLDGARIFNAAVALGVEAATLAAGFDAVMFSLSKGLGAPIGSLLCGGRDFIREARRVRKMFGGTMRQVGVIAAAGLIALRKGPAWLVEDHENAARLAQALAELPGIEIDPATVQTNIVIFRVTRGTAQSLVGRLKESGILAVAIAADKVRFVTHRDVSRPQIERAIERLRQLMERPIGG
jgi:threonine aldolase